jgi:uncharacterized protein
MRDTEINVEVVFALPGRQSLRTVALHDGATVADAVRCSGLQELFPELQLDELPTGIWGRLASRDQVLAAGDRVEIYRPLQMDPREARRRLARSGQTMSSAADGGGNFQRPGFSS